VCGCYTFLYCVVYHIMLLYYDALLCCSIMLVDMLNSVMF